MPAERACAKVNLVLRVRGRRADGFHELESLVAFAGAGDRLAFEPGADWSLDVAGREASLIAGDNLVLRAARAMGARWPKIPRGRFRLMKRLPVASGIGGGSADAAAAIRLLARAAGIPAADPDLLDVAAGIGSDVPVCIASQARIFRGRGDVLDPPIPLPPLPAVLVNPGIAVPTAEVFRALGLQPGGIPSVEPRFEAPAVGDAGKLIDWLAAERNDLEAPAIRLCPLIGTVLARLRAMPGCRLARMSGSGATVFGLFESRHAAAAAARLIRQSNPNWWASPTILR